jgi:hypothetical protein
MSIDLDSIDQVSDLIDRYMFLPFYDNVYQAAQNSKYVAYAAPLIGVVDALANLVQAVGAVGESAIKGIINLVYGAVTCNPLKLKVSAVQLVLGTGFISLVSLPRIAVHALKITYGMFRTPVETSHCQLGEYRQKVIDAHPPVNVTPRMKRAEEVRV